MALFYLFFFPAYFGGAAAARWTGPPRVPAAAWEMAIPLAPVMILPYLVLFPLFLLPAFTMTPEAMARLSRQSSAALVAAFVVFALAPTRVGHPPPAVDEPWAAIFGLLATLDTQANALPSLHVVFAALILSGAAEGARPLAKASCACAFLLVAASTLLTHQHHVLDVAAGLALALVVRRLWPLRDDP